MAPKLETVSFEGIVPKALPFQLKCLSLTPFGQVAHSIRSVVSIIPAISFDSSKQSFPPTRNVNAPTPTTNANEYSPEPYTHVLLCDMPGFKSPVRGWSLVFVSPIPLDHFPSMTPLCPRTTRSRTTSTGKVAKSATSTKQAS